jgi:sulfur carrier protein
VIAVSVNGSERELPEQATLADVLRLAGAQGGARGYAIALDGSVIPRARWSQTIVQPGARIEIVVAVQGG